MRGPRSCRRSSAAGLRAAPTTPSCGASRRRKRGGGSSARRRTCSSATATRRLRWPRSRPLPGVSLKTVYLAFETKSGLLRALWHLLLRGERDSAPVAEQSWYRAVLEEPDPVRQLHLNIRNSLVVKTRAGRMLDVIRSA